MGWTGQETDSVRRAVRWGWTVNILGNILQRGWRRGLRLGFGGGLGGSARLEYGACGLQSSSSSGRIGCAWAIVAECSGGACGLPLDLMKLIFAPMSSYGWNLHCGMIKKCFWQLWKFRYIPKLFCFLTNGALIPIVGWINHWLWFWNTQRDKTHCFISTTRSLQRLNKSSIHTLSFSLVFLSNLFKR
jgi:hypothetical protein